MGGGDRVICYRDMTFCPFSDDCEDGNECPRAITVDVQEGAERHNLPLSRFVSEPDCFKEKER